jgi:hypothetical protein
MTVQLFRIHCAGYVRPRDTNNEISAAEYALEMCRVSGTASLITDMTSGKSLGGYQIDPETGLPVSYWL